MAALAALAATGCARGHRVRSDLQPLTAEGGPREYLLIELVRQAHVTGLERMIDVSACQWHVNPAGALYGDHWGWCEDFQILPRSSPGYLLLTTQFGGEMAGAYGTMVVLPPLPASVEAFGKQLRLSEAEGHVRVDFAGTAADLAVRAPAPLGGERTLVEPPVDTGHFEPGFDHPVPADVTYTAISYGRLDSRKIAGRG